jgi:metallophosphoesterase superfamily enzyme
VTGVAFGERAAYLRAHDALVLADPHVGRAEASAVSLPIGEREDLVGRLAGLVARFDPATVVVAGDVVHTFDRVSDRSRGTLTALGDVCEASGARFELVAGNHDSALASAWDGAVHEEYVLDAAADEPDASSTVVCHGHEAPSAAADRYVVGHVHPTIEIEGDRRPCFLRGEGAYRGADLLVLPAFTRLAPGVAVNDMRTEAFDCPLVTDADRRAPIVIDSKASDAPGAGDGDAAEGGSSGEPLEFPPLGAFRGML